MIYRSFNRSVILRLCLMVLASMGTGIAIYRHDVLLTISLFLITIATLFNLIYFLNSINRKVAFFFDSIINEDTSVHFPERIKPGSLLSLHQSLNRLNKHIAEIRFKNEYNEKFFLEMLKSSATGLIAVDEKGYIEQINDSALELIGLPAISHIDLLKQKNRQLSEKMLQIKPGQGYTLKVLHNNELRLLSLKMALLNFSSKQYRLYSISDIKTELEENELDSWQKLIRVMTHEIMNSIAPISSLSNTLSRIFIKNRKPLPPEKLTKKQIDYIINGLQVIENTGKGLMRFVEDYRKLTRIPSPKFKPVNINNWLSGVRLLMKNRMEEESVRFSIIRKGSIEEITGDEKLLNQVMINLLNNAIDALKNTTHKRIIISVFENTVGRLRIKISDNGKGIPADEIDKVFIPFYTTKENGSGIGLSLARKIMRLHKGSISVLSKPDIQTAFLLSF